MTEEQQRAALRAAGEKIRRLMHDTTRAQLTRIYLASAPNLDVDLLDRALAPFVNQQDELLDAFLDEVEAEMLPPAPATLAGDGGPQGATRGARTTPGERRRRRTR